MSSAPDKINESRYKLIWRDEHGVEKIIQVFYDIAGGRFDAKEGFKRMSADKETFFYTIEITRAAQGETV